jgi:hypothetical protein
VRDDEIGAGDIDDTDCCEDAVAGIMALVVIDLKAVKSRCYLT